MSIYPSLGLGDPSSLCFERNPYFSVSFAMEYEKEFLAAVEDGVFIKVFELLHEYKYKMNYNIYTRTLHTAIKKGYTDIFIAIANVSSSLRNNYYQFPGHLKQAFKYKRLEIFIYLTEQCVVKRWYNYYIHYAIENIRDAKFLQMLLQYSNVKFTSEPLQLLKIVYSVFLIHFPYDCNSNSIGKFIVIYNYFMGYLFEYTNEQVRRFPKMLKSRKTKEKKTYFTAEYLKGKKIQPKKDEQKDKKECFIDLEFMQMYIFRKQKQAQEKLINLLKCRQTPIPTDLTLLIVGYLFKRILI